RESRSLGISPALIHSISTAGDMAITVGPSAGGGNSCAGVAGRRGAPGNPRERLRGRLVARRKKSLGCPWVQRKDAIGVPGRESSRRVVRKARSHPGLAEGRPRGDPRERLALGGGSLRPQE